MIQDDADAPHGDARIQVANAKAVQIEQEAKVRWCIIARAENLFQPRDKVLAYSRWVLPCCTACASVLERN